MILDLFEIGYKDVEYAIKTLKYLETDSPKTLILISSVKTWAKSGKKVKGPEEEEEEEFVDDDPEDDAEESAGEEEEPEEE